KTSKRIDNHILYLRPRIRWNERIVFEHHLDGKINNRGRLIFDSISRNWRRVLWTWILNIDCDVSCVLATRSFSRPDCCRYILLVSSQCADIQRVRKQSHPTHCLDSILNILSDKSIKHARNSKDSTQD